MAGDTAVLLTPETEGNTGNKEVTEAGGLEEFLPSAAGAPKKEQSMSMMTDRSTTTLVDDSTEDTDIGMDEISWHSNRDFFDVDASAKNDKEQTGSLPRTRKKMNADPLPNRRSLRLSVVMPMPTSSLTMNMKDLLGSLPKNKSGSTTNARSTMSRDEAGGSFESSRAEAKAVLNTLQQLWGVEASDFNLNTSAPLSQSVLTEISDAILVSESWNKILAFRSMFAEALVGRWRVLVAADEIRLEKENKAKAFWVQNILSSTGPRQTQHQLKSKVLHMIETNADPIANHFGTRTSSLVILCVGALDAAAENLCPHRVIQREAYRPLKGSADPDPSISGIFFHEKECITFEDFCKQFGRYGLPPRFWLSFCEAFLWAMKGHNPYSIADEQDDLASSPSESAHAKFIAGMFVLPMVEASLRRIHRVSEDTVVQELKVACSWEKLEGDFENVAGSALNKLFENFPDMSDHFSDSDAEDILSRLFQLTIEMVQHSHAIESPSSSIRILCTSLGDKWSDLGLSVEALLLLSKEFVRDISQLLRGDGEDSDPKELQAAFSFLFRECMQFVLQPILINQNLWLEAGRFYDDVAKELNWSPQFQQRRLFEVQTEIFASGTYTHTKEELEVGARLAWRNSAKCVGRIAWNTLEVRDCRHCEQPYEIFSEVVEHLKIATGGTNIQSVMTVFRPQRSDEVWGMRFWSNQFVRYAGYKDESSDTILGDPANAEFTTFLTSNRIWKPPSTRSAFDVLPIVLKIPNNDIPFVYELPKEVTHEVELEHPKYPGVKDLGYKWGAVPAISNFTMDLGGIKYPCAPFNGWFVSIEIARNLLERYNATEPLAEAFGMDLTDKLLHQKVSAELETAILHSFEKNKFTVVDPMTVGKSFLTHCKRERTSGRECPAQWSWIGGLLGPTNPTWHLEMRDFKKTPQYDYCCDPWRVLDFGEKKNAIGPAEGALVRGNEDPLLPRILIAYGSETGTAEAAATSLNRYFKLVNPSLLTLNDVAKLDQATIQEFTHMLIICATFGAGEPPNNAAMFFSKDLNGVIKKGAKFAVLALGSSLYPEYCKAGKDADDKMNEAGAEQIMEITRADSAQGDQTTIREWMNRVKKLVLPDVLHDKLKAGYAMSGRGPLLPSYLMKWRNEDAEGEAWLTKKKDEGTLQCISNRELFGKSDGMDPTRSTRHIELDLPDEMSYETGDHLSVAPINSMDVVARFCKCFAHEIEKAAVKSGYYSLKLEEDTRQSLTAKSTNLSCTPSLLWQIHQSFYIECTEGGRASLYSANHLVNKTLADVLQKGLDLSFHSTSYLVDFLSMLSRKMGTMRGTSATAVLFKKEVMPIIEQESDVDDGSKRIRVFIEKYPTIVDFLETFDEVLCRPAGGQPLVSLADVLVLIPCLQPRQYSISSSDVISPRRLSITTGVVNYVSKNLVPVKGVCSNYLAGLAIGQFVDARVVKSSFHPPDDSSCPLIMIAAGTGLAPFMGFLQERANAMAESNIGFGKCHLFFGCRSDEEFTYNDQLTQWESKGVVELHLAQTRQKGKPKKYVQGALKDYGQDLASLLLSQEMAKVYICGNAKMADECSDVCIELLAKYGEMSVMSATQWLWSMRFDNRWQFDVWGQAKPINAVTNATKGRSLRESQVDWIANF